MNDTQPIATPNDQQIREILSQVQDPEVGANIVDMGLIYRIEIHPGEVVIDITMTSPACPMSGLILDDMNAELSRHLPPDMAHTIHLVWDPPWDPSKMSPALKARFHFEDPNDISGLDLDRYLK